MTNKTQHTPTPWHFAPGELIYGPKGETVASCRFVTNFKEENVENMRLIVRAVNSHEALIEAVKDIRYAFYVENSSKKLKEAMAKHAETLQAIIKAEDK